MGKDHIVLPAIAGITLGRGSTMTTLSGNITANIARNLWTWAVIFCGHFTEQAHIYTHLDADESKGDWYVRQILGSSNIQGSALFHILNGNLSHQIEHHIFPDMPASHYAKISPQVQAICRKYSLAYNTGRFSSQFRQVLGRIHHFSKPSAKEWRAYKLSILNVNGPVASNGSGFDADTDFNSATNSESDSKKVKSETQTTRGGLSECLPQVVRQALFYAR